ncbi:glycosyltransferase [Microvirga mediterraneensis]|uniref:Glycosyltransferase n=1 Tax=Microvirga mediterraneensis TaxID=2754695 RepID=A0A838BRE3_9HYPH|nr:glycosyltransferase [Microvirga mediterraneensis]
MNVSVIIKALNEETNIARAIESSLEAVKIVGGEVILADSLSSDRTVEIASAYPIKIVQLTDAADRCCGAAPQLGFQYCSGEFIYLLDGDMAIDLSFLPAALKALQDDKGLAGVGGIVQDMNLDSLEFASRAARAKADLKPGEVDRLDGGGLYRRSALESVSYFTDRNLHAFEEFELATRLREKGWRLSRIDRLAVEHYGYEIGAYQLLWRRVTGGYALGSGELLRAMIGRSSFLETVRKIRTLWTSAVVIAWLASLILVWVAVDGMLQRAVISGLLFVAPFALMSLRRLSVSLGVYAVTAWIVLTFTAIRGLLRRRVDPRAWIPSRIVHDSTRSTSSESIGRISA